MKKSLTLWQLGGFIFTGISGVLLHFLYDWTNRSFLIAPFSAVNESIWEHMKLLFFPMFLFALIEYRVVGRDHMNFWFAKLAGVAVGLLIIPMIYYTYTGALGVSADWFNIAVYFMAAAAAYYLETKLLREKINFCKSSFAPFAVVSLVAVLFIVFTFVQPEIPLFQDPVTGKYGM